LALSADDSTVAYIADASGTFNVTLQDVAGSGAREITDHPYRTVRAVAWHPDGKGLIYLADTNGDENAQLYRVDAAGGVSEALTDVPGSRFIEPKGDPFTRDGTAIVYTGNDRSPGDQDILIRELATGTVTRAYTGGGRVFAGHWSPDGSRVTAVHFIEGNSHHVLYVVPRNGGSAVRLTPQDTVATFWPGPWLPDGNTFLVRSNKDREFTGLGMMNAATGELTWIDTPDWEVEDVQLSSDGRILIWMLNVDGATALRGRDLKTGAELAFPQLPTGEISATALAGDGRFAVMLLTRPTRPRNIAVVDIAAGADGSVRWLTDVTPVASDPATFVEPTVVRFPSRDGTLVPANLYRPPGDDPVGVVISIHGGPVWQDRLSYVHDGLYQYLLQQGVAILAPNIRGSWGYGNRYTFRLYHDWGGVDLEDIAAAAAFLTAQPWIDADRIGLYGVSYGGFVALSCAARMPDVGWAATVTDRAPVNLLTLAKSSPPTLRSMIATVIGDPETEPEFLLSRSPITYADDIRSPLFVIQGANDPRVPQQESDQIADRMRNRGIEFRRDLYADEGHGFTKADNQTKATSDAADFLIKHLGRR